LSAYKKKLTSLRQLPPSVLAALETLPASSHPMDVMRTASPPSAALYPKMTSTIRGRTPDHRPPLATLSPMLLYWHHFSHGGKRIDIATADESLGGYFLHLLHGKPPSASWVKAMHASLVLYAEHEFNASTFTARVVAGTGSDMYSAITAAIGALRALSMAAPTKSPAVIQKTLLHSRPSRGRHPQSPRRQRNRHRFRSPGLHRVRPPQQRDKEIARNSVRNKKIPRLRRRRAHRAGHVA